MAQRYDIGTLQPVQRRSDGTIIADALLTRCGIFEYADADSPTGVRRELRLPEEVSDPASLVTLTGRPVTNDHPSGMIDSTCATEYAVGGVAEPARMDDDHVRSRLSVWDGKTIGDMERGKRDVSLGYVCDVEEKSGTHPIWGDFDAIQRNIRYNHVAVVDQGRAGTARARMDGMAIRPSAGTALASRNAVRHTGGSMAGNTARVDVVIRTDKGEPSASATVDPDDLASRNAAGETEAKSAAKAQPGKFTDRAGNAVRGAEDDPEYARSGMDDDDDGDDDEDDSYDSDMYDDEGNLTPEAARKIAASSFALPDKQKLPIHDPKAVRKSMKGFADADFESPDEKHGAFNRIKAKATQFGIKTGGFQKAHAGKLDKLDTANKDETQMPIDDKAAKAAKAAKKAERKAKLDAAEKTASEAKAAQAKVEGERDAAIARADAAEKALETAKKTATTDDAKRIDAKVALLEQARATGAKVDATMSDRAIKVAAIKHVTKADIADDKHDAYVDARYEGAIEHAKTDAAATAAGANAIAGARAAAVGDPLKTSAHADASDDNDEDAAARRMRVDTATSWQQPGRKSKGN